MNKEKEFKQELSNLINKYSLENDSETLDYILADYLYNCLKNYNSTTELKNIWYGKKITINGIEEIKENE